ncbi:Fpg/Nei family DNA glycosylase [Streptomyces odonnellii]|uniref:Fpg/Nei family DNA glycosylase n=1 Tax=Streptomyces odonnellii TaxID=1417980 RepID=UPI00062648DA|nr:DNA-formamidopyrimidine glycosylase family protein [Streptomyces odonnellii]
MPELPDVEAFRSCLASCAQGRTIERVEVYDAGVLHGVSVRRFRQELEGRSFAEPERRGKWLLARTDGPTVLLHFGMTGLLVCCRPAEELHTHDRVAFTVGHDRQLRYRDQRKLKGLWLAEESGVARILDGQGPDATKIARGDFDRLLSGRRGSVKPLLVDQSRLAGLGNLLVDEILWRARLHPAHRADTLTEEQRGRLYTDMRRTLRSAVRAGRVPPRDSWLTGHRDRTDASCPRCGESLRRGRVAGRGTVWCPRCQPD